jgi:O-acetyl-ADP-ribose deacetylase (regulator of RNase III)
MAVTNVFGLTTEATFSVTIACPADFNADGGVDGNDVQAFFAVWESGSFDADMNADGGVDFQDVEAFFTRWENGC